MTKQYENISEYYHRFKQPHPKEVESIIILSSSYSNGKLTYSHITNYKDGTEGRGTRFVEIEEAECKRIEKLIQEMEL